jgi:hypothetical protein
LVLTHLEIPFDGEGQEWWEGIPSFCQRAMSQFDTTKQIYHERKAIRKPNQEKKNVRPYLLMGFRTGIERAFLLMGLISGALHNWAKAKGISAVVPKLHLVCCRPVVEDSKFATRRCRLKKRKITGTGPVRNDELVIR